MHRDPFLQSGHGTRSVIFVLSLDIRQYAFGISVQSDEKSDSASAALSLCGIALSFLRNTTLFRFPRKSIE